MVGPTTVTREIGVRVPGGEPQIRQGGRVDDGNWLLTNRGNSNVGSNPTPVSKHLRG